MWQFQIDWKTADSFSHTPSKVSSNNDRLAFNHILIFLPLFFNLVDNFPFSLSREMNAKIYRYIPSLPSPPRDCLTERERPRIMISIFAAPLMKKEVPLDARTSKWDVDQWFQSSLADGGGGASISVNGSMGFYDEWGACEWEGGGDVIRKEVWVLQRQD